MKKISLVILGVIIVAAVLYFAKNSSQPDLVSGGLRITSPNGGETIKKGVNHDILWESLSDAPSNTGSIYAQSSVESAELYLIAKGIDLSSEGFGWKTGDILRNSRIVFGAIPSGEYKIKVCHDLSGACDLSDGYFSLTD